jgi:hypothetical protein
VARKLKTYQTSIGFFDLAIAAPSMKAALEIWGADSNLFHQGFARETADPAVVAATIEHAGIVLRRPVGTNGTFKETAELPKVEPARAFRDGDRRAATFGPDDDDLAIRQPLHLSAARFPSRSHALSECGPYTARSWVSVLKGPCAEIRPAV